MLRLLLLSITKNCKFKITYIGVEEIDVAPYEAVRRVRSNSFLADSGRQRTTLGVHESSRGATPELNIGAVLKDAKIQLVLYKLLQLSYFHVMSAHFESHFLCAYCQVFWSYLVDPILLPLSHASPSHALTSWSYIYCIQHIYSHTITVYTDS